MKPLEKGIAKVRKINPIAKQISTIREKV